MVVTIVTPVLLLSAGDFEKYDEGMPPLSGFWQSVFNSSNLLVGVGLLSLPYACRLAGWFTVFILFFFAWMTNYTAKLLGKIMEYQSSVKLRDGPGAYTIYGFADMGMVAFGNWGKYLMVLIFVVRYPFRHTPIHLCRVMPLQTYTHFVTLFACV